MRAYWYYRHLIIVHCFKIITNIACGMRLPPIDLIIIIIIIKCFY